MRNAARSSIHNFNIDSGKHNRIQFSNKITIFVFCISREHLGGFIHWCYPATTRATSLAYFLGTVEGEVDGLVGITCCPAAEEYHFLRLIRAEYIVMFVHIVGARAGIRALYGPDQAILFSHHTR